MDKKAEAKKLLQEGANVYQVINKTGLDMTQVCAIVRAMREGVNE